MFKLTEEVPGSSLLGDKYRPGVYENGLLTITTEEDSIDLAESLEWPIYHDYRVIAYNCMGDLFIQKINTESIGYVWLQYGYGRFIARNSSDWLRLIDEDGENKAKFLETYAQSHLLNHKGALPYGSVYTTAPILALGGGTTLADLNRCGIGHLNVYLSIVSQLFEPNHWGEFA